MGLRQSKQGFRAYILETAAGETYIEERKPHRSGFTIMRLSSAEGRVALANANTIDDFQNKLFLDGRRRRHNWTSWTTYSTQD